MELTANTMGFLGKLNGKDVSVTTNKGAVTAQVSEGSNYAIVSKIEGATEPNIQFQSQGGALDYSIVAELEAIVNEKYASLQALYMQIY